MPRVRHWLVITAALFLAAIALGLVAAHTGVIAPHEYSVERHLQTSLRAPWLNTVMLDAADVASPVAGLAIIALVTGFLLWRRRPVQAVSTFLVIAVGWNSSEIAKVIVMRHRPPALYSLAPETGSNSYPSGHTSFALSLAVALWFLARGTRWERLTIGLGAAWTVLIGFSRVYIGAHYPSDVIGSVLISSSAIVCLCGLWHGWIAGRLERVPLLGRFGPLTAPVSQ